MGLRSVVDQHFQKAPVNGVERWGTLVGPSPFLPLEMPTGEPSANHQLDEETVGGRRQSDSACGPDDVGEWPSPAGRPPRTPFLGENNRLWVHFPFCYSDKLGSPYATQVPLSLPCGGPLPVRDTVLHLCKSTGTPAPSEAQKGPCFQNTS